MFLWSRGGLKDGPGNGAKINVEGALVETSGFSPSQHPRSTGDVDTEREGLPDTAGIPRATEEAVGLQEREEGGVEKGRLLWEET